MFLIILVTFLLVWFVTRHYARARKLPPGPISLPLIGNIHQLVYYVWQAKGIVPAFDLLRKKYGDVFTLWLGPIPHVSITDYDTAHEFFIKNGNKFRDRFLIPIFDHVSNGHGLLFNNGEEWAELRRFALLTFRTMGVGRDLMEEKIMAELNARCLEIDAQAVDGTTVVHTSEFFDLTVGSVINSLIIGKRFDEHNKDEFLKLKQFMESAGEAFSMFDTTVPVWVLKYFFPRRYDLLYGTQVASIDYVSREAVQRLADIKSGKYILNSEDPQDFVDAFLAKMEQAERTGGNHAYTMESLKIVLGDIWAAGQGTTTTTLVSGFNQLVNHPDVIAKVRRELLKVTNDGSRALSLQDRAHTPYLNATLAEIQRHALILNVNFWRVLSESVDIKGYHIESGALVTAQLGALHVNDTIFTEPEQFRPERFIENEALLHQIIPFGIGKRSCVGENIARSELYLVLGNLLLRYGIRAHGALPSTADQLPYTAGKFPDKTVRLEFVKLM